MNLTVTATIQAEVSDSELASALVAKAIQMAGNPDMADCDLYTDHHGRTYGACDAAWCISCDPRVAALVDASWALRGEMPGEYKVSDRQIEREKERQGLLAQRTTLDLESEEIRREFSISPEQHARLAEIMTERAGIDDAIFQIENAEI
jgi:hypothetical protein